MVRPGLIFVFFATAVLAWVCALPFRRCSGMYGYVQQQILREPRVWWDGVLGVLVCWGVFCLLCVCVLVWMWMCVLFLFLFFEGGRAASVFVFSRWELLSHAVSGPWFFP